MSREANGHTLDATGLVHELYLKLVNQRKTEFVDSNHFYSFAAHLMRRALDEIEQLDPRKVRLIELKVFLGCSTEEAAHVARVSKATAESRPAGGEGMAVPSPPPAAQRTREQPLRETANYWRS